MKAEIDKMKINYRGKDVTARRLTVSSDIPININTAWEKVQTSALLEFVAKGKLRFKPLDGKFPEIWKQGATVKTAMYAYGIIPLGGVHTLYMEKIDGENKVIQSKEWDSFASVWNHKISMKRTGDGSIRYEDEIIIYGGLWTGLISLWAKSFYRHRQKRWQLVACDVSKNVNQQQ
jgi:hypothetical protein